MRYKKKRKETKRRKMNHIRRHKTTYVPKIKMLHFLNCYVRPACLTQKPVKYVTREKIENDHCSST